MQKEKCNFFVGYIIAFFCNSIGIRADSTVFMTDKIYARFKNAE